MALNKKTASKQEPYKYGKPVTVRLPTDVVAMIEQACVTEERPKQVIIARAIRKCYETRQI